jgi:hypothetical protein
MKTALLAVTLLMVDCSSADRGTPFAPVARNLSESEVRALPAGTSFEDVSARLRYFTRAAVAIPMISFALGEQDTMECVMFFDRAGRLRYAWLSPVGHAVRGEAIVIWPRSAVGKKVSELEPLFGCSEPSSFRSEVQRSGGADGGK